MTDNVSGPLTGLIGVVVPVFELFRDFRVAIVLAGGIFAVAILLLLWFTLVKMLPLARRLDGLNRRIRAIPGRAELVAAMPEINRSVLRIGALAPAWRRFTDLLLPPRQGVSEVWRATARPGQVLTLDALDAGGADIRFYQSLPNYFVGVGLVLTFLGLVAALYFASQAVASSDVRVAQAALGDLLQAATFKFLTSIAGLSSSLLLSIAFRLSVQGVNRSLSRVCEALDQRLLIVTPVGLGIDQLEEARRLTDGVSRLTKGLPPAIAAEMDQRLTASLPPILATATTPIASSIGGMARALGSINQEALSQMVGDFQNTLSREAGREVAALAEMMVEIRNTLRLLNSALQQTGASFGSQIGQAAERLESLTAGAGNSFKEDMMDAARQLATSSKPVMQMTERLIQASGELGAATNALVKTQSGFDALAQQLTATTKTLESAVQDHQRRFEQIDQQLAGAFGVFVKGADQYRTQLQTFMRELDGHLDKTLGAIANGVDELAHVVEDLGRVAKTRDLARTE